METKKAIPSDKVEIAPGVVINKTDACRLMRQHHKQTDMYFDSKGQCYILDSKGTQRKFPPKEQEKYYNAILEDVYKMAFDDGVKSVNKKVINESTKENELILLNEVAETLTNPSEVKL